jgi:hypothetical protein
MRARPRRQVLAASKTDLEGQRGWRRRKQAGEIHNSRRGDRNAQSGQQLV